MILLSKIMEFYRLPEKELSVIPKFELDTTSFGLSRRMRRGLALAFICTVFSAMAAYIWAVNTILFDGIAIQKNNAVAAILEREYSDLESILAERQSPLWLEETARINGMVEVTDVRYLRPGESVALLH